MRLVPWRHARPVAVALAAAAELVGAAVTAVAAVAGEAAAAAAAVVMAVAAAVAAEAAAAAAEAATAAVAVAAAVTDRQTVQTLRQARVQITKGPLGPFSRAQLALPFIGRLVGCASFLMSLGTVSHALGR